MQMLDPAGVEPNSDQPVSGAGHDDASAAPRKAMPRRPDRVGGDDPVPDVELGWLIEGRQRRQRSPLWLRQEPGSPVRRPAGRSRLRRGTPGGFGFGFGMGPRCPVLLAGFRTSRGPDGPRSVRRNGGAASDRRAAGAGEQHAARAEQRQGPE